MFRRSLLNSLVGLFVATSTNPGHARLPAVWVGPYDLTATLTQEPVLVWGDPAKPSSKVDTRTDKAQLLKAQVLKEQGSDATKAVDALMARRQEPDAAQALYQAMVELATGKAAGINDGVIPPPVKEGKAGAKIEEIQPYIAPQGKTGISLVAGVAKALAPVMGQAAMKPFDQVIFEHAIRLMGFHGAPVKEGTPTTQGQAAPTQAPAPIDPEVRATLRSLLGSRNTQVYAARALGQLGDMETAKEIIDHPGKYPDASISDFGPDALNRYKNTRKEAIAQGKGAGEGAFFQSLRIPPQHQDAAIELAMAGDGGAILATQRNWSVMNAKEKDVDTVLAEGIDAALRFPGTRAGWVGARRGVEGFFNDPYVGPKSYAMILRAVEGDLKIIFSDQPWDWSQMLVLTRHSGIFNGLWHAVRYGKGVCDDRDRKLEKELEALFRRLYRPHTNIGPMGTFAGFEIGTAWELAIYAGHLKLKPLEFEQKKEEKRLEISIGERPGNKGIKFYDIKLGMERWSDDKFKIWRGQVYVCEVAGDIHHVEDL